LSILLNELSVARQFTSTHSFLQALEVLMQLRQVSESHGHKIECSNAIFNAQATNEASFYEAIQAFQDKNKKRSVMAWITKAVSSWDIGRLHSDDDYLICNEEVVTGTAIGETAYRKFENNESSLVSFTPSDWTISPISVDYYDNNGAIEKSCSIENHWTEKELTDYLESIQVSIQSWEMLDRRMRKECNNICFSEGAFNPLFSHPFMSGAADRICFLLSTLNRMKECYDDSGSRTAEGHQVYQDFFTGKKGGGGRGALFTDSSESEKRCFRDKLTFEKPGTDSETLFCPWHGKIQTPQYRVHFSYPMNAKDLFYVVYIGPKLTV